MICLNRAGVFISASIAFSVVVEAGTNFYVDSDWTGVKSGTQSQPFAILDKSAWHGINAALASSDVTIYFSARKAGSDTPDYYDTRGNGVQLEVDLTKKTTSGSHVLTLDGKSFYNTSESSPSWASYSGSNMCIVRDFNSQNLSHIKYSNVTIHGFNVICNAGTKAVSICGDNWTVENCDIAHTPPANLGPCVLLVPTADGAHDGSNSYAPPCNNITIQNNVIHDTYGEGCYLGGGGSSPGTAGSGYPSHTNVSVLNNEIYSTGRWGGQGDGIDVKGGIQQLDVKGNNIHDVAYADNGCRGIVMQGQIVPSIGLGTLQTYERNYIHNCNHVTEGIAMSDTYGVPAGVVIRNNIISGVTGSTGSKAGIIVYSTQDQIRIQNNTIYNCAGQGIGTSSGSNVLLRNNFLFGNNGTADQVDLSHGTVDSDYNAYSTPWGYTLEGTHSVSLTPDQALAAVVNVDAGDFHPSETSPLKDAAVTLDSFSDDFYGTVRISGHWDIGAVQTYERNYIHNCSQITEAVALSDTWGIPASVVIRNNIISGVTGSAGSKAGIGVASTQDRTLIRNNTIYNCAGLGIATIVDAANVLLRNNLLIANNLGSHQVDLSHGTVDSDYYNAYSDTWGYGREGRHALALSAVDVTNTLVNPAGGDFHLMAGAPVIDKAETQAMVSDDFSGATRGPSWDVGAFRASRRP